MELLAPSVVRSFMCYMCIFIYFPQEIKSAVKSIHHKILNNLLLTSTTYKPNILIKIDEKSFYSFFLWLFSTLDLTSYRGTHLYQGQGRKVSLISYCPLLPPNKIATCPYQTKISRILHSLSNATMK